LGGGSKRGDRAARNTRDRESRSRIKEMRGRGWQTQAGYAAETSSNRGLEKEEEIGSAQRKPAGTQKEKSTARGEDGLTSPWFLEERRREKNRKRRRRKARTCSDDQLGYLQHDTAYERKWKRSVREKEEVRAGWTQAIVKS